MLSSKIKTTLSNCFAIVFAGLAFHFPRHLNCEWIYLEKAVHYPTAPPSAKHSGQHLVVRGQWNGQPVTRYSKIWISFQNFFPRQYSILSRASTAGSFSLLIKVGVWWNSLSSKTGVVFVQVYPLGIMSRVVQDWAVGSRWQPSLGKYFA